MPYDNLPGPLSIQPASAERPNQDAERDENDGSGEGRFVDAPSGDAVQVANEARMARGRYMLTSAKRSR